MRWTVNSQTGMERLATALGINVKRRGSYWYWQPPGTSDETREGASLRVLARLVDYAVLAPDMGGPGWTMAQVADATRWDGRIPQGSNAPPAHYEWALQRLHKANLNLKGIVE